MKSLALVAVAAGTLIIPVSVAQTPQGTRDTTTAPTAVTPATPSPTNNRDAAAASGDSNQAVATTSADALTPAKGANSFTMEQARSRIADKGFSNIGDLVKDEDGIWRGKAQKAGTSTGAWLDYKGNVGESR
ncbi:MAG: hypothetical protein AB7F35_25490 [Acetobacteraceae bacterium]